MASRAVHTLDEIGFAIMARFPVMAAACLVWFCAGTVLALVEELPSPTLPPSETSSPVAHIFILTLAVLVIGLLFALWLGRLIMRGFYSPPRSPGAVSNREIELKIDKVSRAKTKDLAVAFNQMVDALSEKDAALERAVTELNVYKAELEKKVRERTSELESAQVRLIQSEKLSAIGELISGITHELNNPLASILGYSQLLLQSEMDEKTRKRLQAIYEQSKRCQRIVHNLLVFARKHQPERKLISLNDVISATIDLVVYQLKTDNISVNAELDPGLPLTYADYYQLQQVFVNLMTNAAQAIGKSSKNGHIRIVSAAEGNKIRVTVADNGPGIPKELLSRIFDPFFTTKKEGEGTGLGLSVCYGIVREHGGEIVVNSEIGKGTTFKVDVPVVKPPRPNEKSSEEPKAFQVRMARRVLVVDDEETMRELLVEILQDRTGQVDQSPDGGDAILKLMQHDYDAILLDWKMPNRNGREVFEEVEKLKPQMTRRVIFLSGATADGVSDYAEARGNPWVGKPFSVEDIHHALEKVLRAERS